MSIEIDYRTFHKRQERQYAIQFSYSEPIDIPVTGGAEELISFPPKGVIVDLVATKLPKELPLPPKKHYYPSLQDMAAD